MSETRGLSLPYLQEVLTDRHFANELIEAASFHASRSSRVVFSVLNPEQPELPGLTGHTHRYANHASTLPSAQDLCLFAEENRNSPGIIDSIACLQQDLGQVSLTLIRGRPARDFHVIQRPFNALSDHASEEQITAAVQKSGAVMLGLTYDFMKGGFRDDPRRLGYFY